MGLRSTLITGASSGIGRALANRLADGGADVIGIGRRVLDDISGPLADGVTYINCDLGTPDLAGRLTRRIEAEGVQRFDLIVMNAALGYFGNPATQTPESVRSLINVNLRGPIVATRALASMLRPDGRIVLVGSVAARGAHPRFAVYAATKSGLAGFARHLSAERGMNVTVVHPGPTRTEMHERSGLGETPFDRFFLDPDFVAWRILELAKAGKPRGTVSFVDRVLNGWRWKKHTVRPNAAPEYTEAAQ